MNTDPVAPLGRRVLDDGDIGVGGIAVVSKSFQILRAFDGGANQVIGLTGLAAAVGLPKTTAFRIAATLVSLGVLERDGKRYRLGLGLFELGERVRVKQDLREVALPFLQDLYEATHQTVHLAVLEGSDVVYLERIRGHEPVKVPSRVGGRLPAHWTGVGKALLAYVPGGPGAIGIERLAPRTARTITVPAVLEQELEVIRRTGVALDREESAIGVECVAAAIFVNRAAVAALSVSAPAGRSDLNGLSVAVRAAANGVGRVLSHLSRR